MSDPASTGRSSTTEASASRRLFFALWPEPSLQEALSAATRAVADEVDGRALPGTNLHVTLVFLGSVPEIRLPALRALGARVAQAYPRRAVSNGSSGGSDGNGGNCGSGSKGSAGIEGSGGSNVSGGSKGSTGSKDSGVPVLCFDRLEHWRRAGVIVATASEPPPRLVELARDLRDALVAEGFAPDLKRFRPHVTLVRKARRAVREYVFEKACGAVGNFSLVESRTQREGALYSVVEGWSL